MLNSLYFLHKELYTPLITDKDSDTEPNSCESPPDMYGDDPVLQRQLDEYEEDETPQYAVIDDVTDPEGALSPRSGTSTPEKSLADELLELELDVPAHIPTDTQLQVTPKSDTQHNDDYVDERQIEEYLKQIEMEKCEERLIEDKLLDSSCSSPRDEEDDDSLRTGTRPKQRAAAAPDSLEPATAAELDSLEPTIPYSAPPLAEEEFTISDADLNPVIGREHLYSKSHLIIRTKRIVKTNVFRRM